MEHETLRPLVTRRRFIRGVGLMSAASALAACAREQVAGPSPSSLERPAPLPAIIHTNDTHGHDFEVEATEDDPGNFSMAAVPALKKEWEDKGYDVLLLDAGDATQGAPLVDLSDGERGITFMNSCGYDLMTVGNHEFDHDEDQIKVFEQLAKFPLISASVKMKDTGELRFTPNKMFELTDGTKVGVFGLTTPETLLTAMPAYVEPFTFLAGEDLYQCAQEQVDDLRAQGADLVICLGHLGNEPNLEPSTSKQVLSNVQGIDLFIDGHDHELVEEEVEGTLLVETGCWMENIGLVVIDAGVPTNSSVAHGEFDGIDAATQAIIDDVKAQVDKELSVVLASTPFFLDGDKNKLRVQETNLGDLFCDAMLYDAEQATGQHVDAAINNAGGIRASIEEGDITLEIVKVVLPFTNQVVTLQVTGAQLLETIEASCQAVGYEGQKGSLPQVAGMEYTVNATVPYEQGEQYPNTSYYGPAAPGARVTIHSVGGADFDENATYTIATSDYIAQGGSTYRALKIASESQEPVTCDFDYEAMVSYLIGPLDHEVPERYREPQGRITIITE